MSLLRKFSPCQESPVTAVMRWIPRRASTGGLRGKRRAKGTKVWSPVVLGLFGLLLHVQRGGCSCWGFTGWSWGSWSILEFLCAQRNARGLVTCKSAGTSSQELYLHKGRAWGMKSEPRELLAFNKYPSVLENKHCYSRVVQLCHWICCFTEHGVVAAGLLWG